MKYLWGFLSILPIHFLGGRIISIPYAVILFGNWHPAVWFVWLVDLLFGIPLIHFVLERFRSWRWLSVRIALLTRRIKRWKRKVSHERPIESERKFHSDIIRRAQRWGQFGIVILTSLPVAGGIWSGVLLAKSLRIKTWRSYLLVALGSLVGCLLLALGVHGIRLLILKVINLLKASQIFIFKA